MTIQTLITKLQNLRNRQMFLVGLLVSDGIMAEIHTASTVTGTPYQAQRSDFEGVRVAEIIDVCYEAQPLRAANTVYVQGWWVNENNEAVNRWTDIWNISDIKWQY